MTELKSFETTWGLQGSLVDQLTGIKERGYDGVETPLPSLLARLGWITREEVADFRWVVDDLGLEYLPLILTYSPAFQRVWGIDIEASADHVQTFDAQLEEALALGARQVTSHSGADSMSTAEACDMFGRMVDLEREAGVLVGHETHRLRVLYSPFVWRELRDQLPELRLVIDLSHWVSVCERLPIDVAELIDSAVDRAVHAHCRVGFAQGPQVPDPRMAEHQTTVAWHEEQWARYLARAVGSDAERVTFDPEYGPPPYMHTRPADGVALADLSEVRAYTKVRVESMFKDAQMSA